jgi:uncharacterized protein YbjT (DUF2867 family)
MNQKIVTIVGGTGFLGRYVVHRLAKAGYVLRVIARDADQALYLRTAGDPGQVVLMNGDVTRPESLSGKLINSYAVINLTGILYQSGRQKFDTVHTQGAECLAQMAKTAKAQCFVQVSALGVDKAVNSRYARTKFAGEKAAMAAFPEATILRPGVMFGPEDNFTNQFARMAVLSPVLPLIGGGRTTFQPVYIDDVAAAIETCISNSATKGQIYELGGPETYSFKEILQYIMEVTGRRRLLLPLPFGLAALMGAVLQFLPKPPLTFDQVRLLKRDNVVSASARTFAALGMTPKNMKEIMPFYLNIYRPKPNMRVSVLP